jgi:hypothetical protein
MYKGPISFCAPVIGNGVTFSSVAFNPNTSCVEEIEIACPNGENVYCTIYLVDAPTEDEGKMLAEEQVAGILNKLSFLYNLAIGKERIVANNLESQNALPGVLSARAGSAVLVGESARLLMSIQPAILKAELEQASTTKEALFGLFRSARQSQSPIEEFLHLYNLLLMLCGDDQPTVDAFILAQNPVIQTRDPRPKRKRMETIYTRLRNELGHHRKNVNLSNTKAEMSGRLSELISLTKRAIESQP